MAGGLQRPPCRAAVHPSGFLFLLFTLSSSLFTVHSDDLWGPPQGDISPRDQLLEEYSELVLNCTLLDTYTKPYNASDLHFQVDSKHYFGLPYVHVLSNRTVQLRYPHFNTSHVDAVHCLDPEGNVFRASTTVDCARRPMTPVVTRCIVPDWRNLTCDWEPSLWDQADWSHTIDNRYDLSWSVRSPLFPHLGSVVFDDRDVPTSFTWLPHLGASHLCQGEVYDLTIEASNKLTNVHNFTKPSVSVSVDPCTKVQTNAVSGVSLSGLSSRHVDLSWTAMSVPESVLQKAIKYVVHYSGLWGDEHLEEMREVEEKTSMRLLTQPYVNYSLSIQAVPVVGGHLSAPVLKTWLSSPDRPEMNPDISPFAFEIQNQECGSTQRLVTLHWKELEAKLHNGPQLRYRVQERLPPNAVWRTLEQTTGRKGHSVCVRQDQDVHLRVVAENSVGRADTSSVEVFNIPKEPDALQWFKAQGEDLQNGSSVMHFTWIVDNITQPAQKQKREVKEDVVLLWCQGSAYNCTGALHWKNVNYAEGHHALLLQQPFQLFRYALANSNGLQWSSCCYGYNELPSPPNKVHVKTSSSDHGELDVLITVPLCVSGSGFVEAFDIVFCLTDGNQCIDKEESVRVARGQLGGGAILLHALQVAPGSHHLVSVYSVSRAGRSHVSHPASAAKATESWASAGAVLGVVVACVIVLMLFVGGFVSVIRFCQRKKRNFESGLAITRPPQKHQRHSDCSSTPMLVENYLNGNANRTNGYLRQLSSLSTLSVDSGTGSLNYDQLSPHATDGQQQRKSSAGHMQRFSSIPESPIEEETAQASGGERETSFSTHPKYANVDDYSRLTVAPNDPLPVDQWDAPHKTSQAPIADYTRVANLSPASEQDDRSIGPASHVKNSARDWTPCSDGYSSELPPLHDAGSGQPNQPSVAQAAGGYTAPESLPATSERGYAPHSALLNKDRGYVPHSVLTNSIPSSVNPYTCPEMLAKPHDTGYAPHSALDNPPRVPPLHLDSSNVVGPSSAVYLPVDEIFGQLNTAANVQAKKAPEKPEEAPCAVHSPQMNKAAGGSNGYTSVEGLLSAGAKPTVPTNNGYTPPASLPCPPPMSTYTSPESLQPQSGEGEAARSRSTHDSGYTSQSQLNSSQSDLQAKDAAAAAAIKGSSYVSVDSLQQTAAPSCAQSNGYVPVQSLDPPPPDHLNSGGNSSCHGDSYVSIDEAERRGLISSLVR